MKLSERSIKIKELIHDQVDMGTFGLVELELIEFDKEIQQLKILNIPVVNDTVCVYCNERPRVEPLWLCRECIIAYNKEKQTGR